MFISFILLLGTFPHIVHTNINYLTSGPRKNESARFIYKDPGSHKYAHCMFCDMKALTDSTYSYLQQPACLVHYADNITEMLTSYEIVNKKYALCITGDVPGCGNLSQMSEKSVPDSHWKCDAGYSNSINSVYFSCALIDNITQRVKWNWYCNETLQWEETLSDDEDEIKRNEKPVEDSFTMIFVVTVAVTVICVILVIILKYRWHSLIALVCSTKDVCSKSSNDSYSHMCKSVETPFSKTVRPDTYGAEIESPIPKPSELKNKQHNTIKVIDNHHLSCQLCSEHLRLNASTCTNGARPKNFQSDNKRDHLSDSKQDYLSDNKRDNLSDNKRGHLSRSNHPIDNRCNAGASFQGLRQNAVSMYSNGNTSGYNSQSTVTKLIENLDQVDTLDIQSLISCSNDDNLLNTVMNNRQVAAIKNNEHYPGLLEEESYQFSDRPVIIHRSTGYDEESASIAQEQHNCNKEKRSEPLGISCEIPCTDMMKDDDAVHNTQPKETMTLVEDYEADATEDCTENSPLSVNELNLLDKIDN